MAVASAFRVSESSLLSHSPFPVVTVEPASSATSPVNVDVAAPTVRSTPETESVPVPDIASLTLNAVLAPPVPETLDVPFTASACPAPRVSAVPSVRSPSVSVRPVAPTDSDVLIRAFAPSMTVLPVMLLALSNASTVVAVEPSSAEMTRFPVAVTVPSTVKSAAVAPEVAMVADAPVAFSGPE